MAAELRLLLFVSFSSFIHFLISLERRSTAVALELVWMVSCLDPRV